MTKTNIGDFITGGIVGGAAVLLASSYLSPKIIPSTEKVQSGFIAPSKLEVKLTDLDKNGEQETVLKIGNKQYLLREVDGQPTLSEYLVKPAEITPAQIQYK